MIKKYSVTIAGHSTSITLEPEFWAEIQAIAAAEGKTIAQLVAAVDKTRGTHNLSSALRLRVLRVLKKPLVP